MANRKRPRLAVWKFASCDGCQLSLLDCEDELLALVGRLSIAHFPEASSRRVRGPWDLSLIEGSITTPRDMQRVHDIRRQSRILVCLGACATAGGIQALRNRAQVDDYVAAVYPNPEYIDTLRRSTPVSDHVKVDFELRGCPISKDQLLETLAALLEGRFPELPAYSLCIECKKKGLRCLAVISSAPCMGPVTQAGCGALCPAYGRPCYGCFGPAETPNTRALADHWAEAGASPEVLRRRFSGFNAAALAFEQESDRHG